MKLRRLRAKRTDFFWDMGGDLGLDGGGLPILEMGGTGPDGGGDRVPMGGGPPPSPPIADNPEI